MDQSLLSRQSHYHQCSRAPPDCLATGTYIFVVACDFMGKQNVPDEHSGLFSLRLSDMTAGRRAGHRGTLGGRALCSGAGGQAMGRVDNTEALAQVWVQTVALTPPGQVSHFSPHRPRQDLAPACRASVGIRENHATPCSQPPGGASLEKEPHAPPTLHMQPLLPPWLHLLPNAPSGPASQPMPPPLSPRAASPASSRCSLPPVPRVGGPTLLFPTSVPCLFPAGHLLQGTISVISLFTWLSACHPGTQAPQRQRH